MHRHRILIYIGSAFLLLLMLGSLIGLFLRLLNELRYTLEFFLPYWLVSPLLLLGAVIVVTLIIQTGYPWFKKFIHKKNKSTKRKGIQTSLPMNRRQAAQQSLESIDLILEKLQDEVTRQALEFEKAKVSRELARGDLIVVVFGTGSSGKTSLIRALLNEIVGEVGAAMGSTKESQSYRLRLKRLQRGLKLIDTPGIFESGLDGIAREKEAKRKASKADLMIFVVDSDLRASELQIIKILSNLGKRILLVLNKCDLRGEYEEKKLISLLRGHCQTFITPENIISTSASPQSIPRPGKRPWQPPANVNNLLQRLAKVLHDDGEELIADNILLQCRNLGKKGKQLLNTQRLKEARKCVDRFSWISSGVVAANPLPVIDLLGTAAINAQMVVEIAKIYGVQLTRSRAKELALSVGRTLTGLGLIKGGFGLISTALNLNLPTLILGKAIQGVAVAWLTRISGASFITYFQQDQDWGDGGVQEVVQHHYDLNRRESYLQKFLQTAFKRIVDPLKNEQLQLPTRPTLQEEEEAFDL